MQSSGKLHEEIQSSQLTISDVEPGRRRRLKHGKAALRAARILFHRLGNLLMLVFIFRIWYDLEMAFQRFGMFERKKIKIIHIE